MNENVDRFIESFRESLARGTFIKLTLGNYKGAGAHLQKIQVRLIETKKGNRLYFLYRGDSSDTAKNFAFDESVDLVRKLLGTDFYGAHLFTRENDSQLDIGKRSTRLHSSKPTLKKQADLSHDREKHRWINQNAFYLNALGITTADGKVHDRSQDKWRQINKFVEIIAGLVEKSDLADTKELNIVDMGSGKGYLTFAVYDYFKNVKGVEVEITGVEQRTELVDKCNEIAKASSFEVLKFVRGGIADIPVDDTDILIALHACNTATDDAIYKGTQTNASIIIVAPCCHQELRPQLRSPEMFRDVLKHGIMLERTAEFVTDALRSLLLERSGYQTKLLDFVPLEHTPKNLMIVGVRGSSADRTAEIDREIAEMKRFYSINEQHLEKLLSKHKAALR